MLTLGLLVAGCGDDTGEVPAEASPEPAPVPTAQTPRSRAEFAARANAICAEAASPFGVAALRGYSGPNVGLPSGSAERR